MTSKRLRVRRFTPEFNALHVLFLEESYCIAFIKTVCPEWITAFSLDNIEVNAGALNKARQQLTQAEERLVQAQRAAAATNFIQRRRAATRLDLDQLRAQVIDAQRKVDEESAALDQSKKSAHIQRECKANLHLQDAVDVEINCEFTLHCSPGAAVWKWETDSGSLANAMAKNRGDVIESTRTFRIHVEPTVSDNYPALCRHMLTTKAQYLFVHAYKGEGVTQQQFEAFFRSAGITVVYKTAVDAAQTP